MPDYENPDYEFFLNILKLSDLELSKLKGNNAPDDENLKSSKVKCLESLKNRGQFAELKKHVFSNTLQI